MKWYKAASMMALSAGLFHTPALGQNLLTPIPSPALNFMTAPVPTAEAPANPLVRQERRTLRDLSITSPMQLRGLTDLQGVVFGIREDEVVTAGKLVIDGAFSPSLIPEFSQLAITLNDQPVGSLRPTPGSDRFTRMEFPLDPLHFVEMNRLNFRFSGQYTRECNDPLSGLLWTTVSNLSSIELTVTKLPMTPDLARLPAPFLDMRDLHKPLILPVVLPDPQPDQVRAAVIASSWFAAEANTRRAEFPVFSALPPRGNAMVIAVGGVPQWNIPAFDRPTLSIMTHPQDPAASVLVVGGRTPQEAAIAAQALAVAHQGLSGPQSVVETPNLAQRVPYDAPRWIPTHRPVRFGELASSDQLQANGYVPGPVAIPFRTAPDLYTWKNSAIPVNVRFRAPPGPITDLAVSRMDVAINDVYLKSAPLKEYSSGWGFEWLRRQLARNSPDITETTADIPVYNVIGQNNLQLRFDMRPLHRGDCVAIPADIRSSVDPDSTIDLSQVKRHAVLPNLGFFANSGYPFTRMADFSETMLVMPHQPTPTELSGILNTIGRLSSLVGHPATKISVSGPSGMETNLDKDIMVFGSATRQPALQSLLTNAPIRAEGNRLQLSLPEGFESFKQRFMETQISAQRRQLTTVINTAGGAGHGMMIGGESPLHADRSVVALTGTSPESADAMVNALFDPSLVGKVQGDVAVLTSQKVEAFRVGPSYEVGSLPIWYWPQAYLQGNPFGILVFLGIAVLVMTPPVYFVLRRRVRHRLGQ